MNRTVTFLSLAGGLALMALVLATPEPTSAATTGPNAPKPIIKTTPVDPLPPVPVTSSDGSLRMQGRLSHPVVAVGQSDIFMTVDVTGVTVEGSERAAVNLALVIDRSGSMADEDKIGHAKRAARQLVAQLREGDRLAIVHYGSDVRFLGSLHATAENKQRMLRYINQIEDDGGTNIGAGLQSGRAQLTPHLGEFKVNRLILLSDGQPTEGVTSQSGLLSISRGIRQSGVTVSSIGLGSDFNENVMQGIAENGAGAYGYLSDATKLAGIFAKDLQQAGTTVARNVELSFQLPDGVELADVLGYRFSQAGRSVRVTLPDFSASQAERVVAKLRVRSSVAGQSVDVAKLDLQYTDTLAEKAASSKALLAAMVTEKREEVALRRDKEATVYASRAMAAKNLERAADQLAQGNRERAQELMDENKAVFSEAAVVAGPAAMAPDVAQMEQTEAGLMGAKSDEVRNHEVKAAKAKALKGFGRMGSTY